MLDFAECDRARLTRDPRYDGRFFTGVRTTGVYCRPVCPAWKGSRATVDRALRLIVEEGALDAENARVEDFAGRLGIGARQLSRLFAHHLNATPVQVAKTARVQRAKRLLDVTDLPMTEVALQAGFRSLRRFNAVFAEVYKKSPTQIRLFARANGWGPHVTCARHKPGLVTGRAAGTDETIE